MSQTQINGKTFFIKASLGALVSAAVTVLLLAAAAFLVSSGRVGEEAAVSSAPMLCFVSGIAGALVSASKSGSLRLAGGMAAGAVFSVLLFLTNLLSGHFPGGDYLTSASFCLLGCLAVSVIRPKKRRKRR